MAARRESFTARLKRLIQSPLRRVLEVRLSARQRRALAPTFPHDAEQTLVRASAALSGRMEWLLERHVLAQLPVPGVAPVRDYGAIQRGFETVEGLALDYVKRMRPQAATSGRKALALAAREYERIVGVRLPGRWAKDLLPVYTDTVLTDYARIVRAQLEHWRAVSLEAMVRGEDRELRDLLREGSWVVNNRSATLARTLPFNLYSRAIEKYAIEGGDSQLVWVTMRDERVRESHRPLDGMLYDPKVGINGLLPGSAPNCRCRGIPASALED